jgi:hypothetical protein
MQAVRSRRTRRGAGEAGRAGGGRDDAAGCGPGYAAAVLEVLVQGGGGVGGRAGGLQVDEMRPPAIDGGWRTGKQRVLPYSQA